MKFYIQTFGCQMNVYDTQSLNALLSAAGHTETETLEEAELVLLNTCSIREGAEERVRGRLGQLKKLKKKGLLRYLGVCGCMGQKEGKKLTDAVEHLDLVIGPGAIGSIARLVDKLQQGQRPLIDQHGIEDDLDAANPFNENNIAYPCFVSIMKGCDKKCTYCIVPYVRGPERSRHPDIILQEVQDRVDRGVKEVTLIGQTVNSYHFNDTNFAQLLGYVNQIDGLERIRFATSYPMSADRKMFDAVAELDKVCEHIHLPVQSGSNSVLRKMARGYTREKFVEKIKYYRGLFAGTDIFPAVTTDFIVGFPGETEEDYRETLDLMTELRFDGAFMFKYSPRRGTPSATWDGQLDEFTKARRLEKMIQLQHDISDEINRGWIGKDVEIMIERIIPEENGKAAYECRLRSGRIVKFMDEENNYCIGDIFDVTITDSSSFMLYGHPARKDTTTCVS